MFKVFTAAGIHYIRGAKDGSHTLLPKGEYNKANLNMVNNIDEKACIFILFAI